MLADVHVHLNQDPAASLTRAQSAGVGIVLAAATDVNTSRINVFLAEKYIQVKACIGIHPWRANLFTPEAEKALTELIQKGKVTAISETGIDLVRRLADDFRTELQPLPLEVQVEAFRAQVRLAVNNGLFLVLHDRGSTKEILKVLDDFKDRTPRGIVHGFSGTIDEARQYRQRGFLISINKRNLPAINPVLKTLTLDEIVLETDSSEPAQVIEVCEAVALLKKVTRDEVAEATTANIKKLLESREPGFM
ncbi:MAG: TatD family hydrolase [Moorella humiferrea]|nr:TatD family hydrolase [Moorella humiferrea]